MAASKAQQEATTRYNKKNYDRFLVTVPKGTLDALKEHALSRGESVNAFMKRYVARRTVANRQDRPTTIESRRI